MTRLFATPEPIQITGGSDGVPAGIFFHARWHTITHVCNRWRTTTNWWNAGYVHREYFKVITDAGMLCTVYRDLIDDGWYMERIYD